MASFARADLLPARFPFSERFAFKQRPALVLSSARFQAEHLHYVLAMLTTASMTQWPSDVPIRDFTQAGLVSPSVVRLKLFTLSDELVLGRLGTLSERDQASVRTAVDRLLVE